MHFPATWWLVWFSLLCITSVLVCCYRNNTAGWCQNADVTSSWKKVLGWKVPKDDGEEEGNWKTRKAVAYWNRPIINEYCAPSPFLNCMPLWHQSSFCTILTCSYKVNLSVVCVRYAAATGAKALPCLQLVSSMRHLRSVVSNWASLGCLQYFLMICKLGANLRVSRCLRGDFFETGIEVDIGESWESS